MIVVAIKQGLTDSHSFVSPLACAEDNVPQRLFFFCSDPSFHSASSQQPGIWHAAALVVP